MCRFYLRCNLRDKIDISTDFNSIFFLYFHISRPTYNFQLNKIYRKTEYGSKEI